MNGLAYYNEHDPRAAAWLRELIRGGHIAPGDVDERSIADVQPGDLRGYTQCHFFGGIGGWSLALRLAGWPDHVPVWTSSCPCQPFSCAGQGKGEADERHLWPEFKRLIEAGQPATVFGEQVASKLGREWLAGVFADLEGMAYQRAGADLCAAGVGAPHIRQRLFWVADRESDGWQWRQDSSGQTIGLDQSHGDGWQPGQPAPAANGHGSATGPDGGNGWMGSPIQPGLEGHAGHGHDGRESGRLDPAAHRPIAETGCASLAAWSRFDLIPCADGKARRVESGTFPLAHGIPGRVGLLRGYGNAIVPQVAAQFITAFLEVRSSNLNP